jgi:lipoprotein-anchoring transpeptidase ErfK/SrfK
MNAQHFLAVCVACLASTTAMAAKKSPMRDSAVLRAQVLLDRAHFSSGEIDGANGLNLRTAVKGYQQAKGLRVTGTVNAATLKILNADSAPTLVSYTIKEADVAGPFAPIPEDWADKAVLKTLGFTSALEGLAEKFHASPALLKRLNPGKDLEVAGAEIMVPNVAEAGAMPLAVKVLIDQSDRTVSLIDGSGKTVAQFPASTGSKHDPLPLGSWKVTGVFRHPVFHYNPDLFWDASPGDAKATIAAGPNNPVGVVWVDLSKPHFGIHGTPEPSAIGKTQSHGCIRLTNWDATALAQAVVKGFEVSMQD